MEKGKETRDGGRREEGERKEMKEDVYAPASRDEPKHYIQQMRTEKRIKLKSLVSTLTKK